MTSNEFEALIQWQEEQKAKLLATLGLVEAFLQDIKALKEAQDQMQTKLDSNLHYSMEVFDPGYEWDNTGAYEN